MRYVYYGNYRRKWQTVQLESNHFLGGNLSKYPDYNHPAIVLYFLLCLQEITVFRRAEMSHRKMYQQNEQPRGIRSFVSQREKDELREQQRQQQQEEESEEYKQQKELEQRQRQKEAERRQQEKEAERRRKQREAERRQQQEEAERCQQQEEAEQRQQQEEPERCQQQEEAEQRQQQEEAERRQQQKEAERKEREEAIRDQETRYNSTDYDDMIVWWWVNVVRVCVYVSHLFFLL